MRKLSAISEISVCGGTYSSKQLNLLATYDMKFW